MIIDKVAIELDRIAKSHGGILRPKDVVEAARPEGSVLHYKFPWDKEKVHEDHLLYIARNLIRTVRVTLESRKAEPVLVRRYVSLTPDRKMPDGGYRLMRSVLRNRNQHAQLLADALAEMLIFRQKYAALKELAVVFQEMLKVSQIIQHPPDQRPSEVSPSK